MLLFYSRKGQLPLGKISDRLQVHRASVTDVIDRLVASGYVERMEHERDRRAVLARITRDGKRVAREATDELKPPASGWSRSRTSDVRVCTSC